MADFPWSVVGSFEPGDLFLLVSRAGEGKSWIACYLAAEMSKTCRVGVMTDEPTVCTQRMMALKASDFVVASHTQPVQPGRDPWDTLLKSTPEVVVVDTHPPRYKSRYIRSLKDVALEVDVPLLVTMQRPRCMNASPSIRSFTGAECADVVMGLSNRRGATMEVEILKNRAGRCFSFEIHFDPTALMFGQMVTPLEELALETYGNKTC